ncbi:tail fiber domain-containing protein [Flavobacterium sp.]|uniref:tail fiber domain-containing protein n=1 Tax=Flavobacterium sp. TaxID=239 RepID=UPI0025BA0FB5|nr:tail fiber domain-containing protein [Flavobacterium sp.]
MKRMLQLLILFGYTAFSQVGVNTTSPNAQLDIRSTNQANPTNTDGILIPKVDAFPAINPTSAQNGMLVFLTTVAGANQPGFYYWENATASWKGISNPSGADADFYEVGSTIAPNNINDAMYHSGDVGIGKTTAATKLDVEETSNSKAIAVSFTHSNPGGISQVLRNTINSGSLATGVMTATDNRVTVGNSVQGVGVSNILSGTSNDETMGVRNALTQTGTGIKVGVSNTFSGTGTGQLYGIRNTFSSPSTTVQMGVFNTFSGLPVGATYGINNIIADSGNGIKVGVRDSISNSGSGDHFGVRNLFSGIGSGDRYGVYAKYMGAGSGNIYNNYSEIRNSGDGNFYSNYNQIDGSGSGTHMGTMSEIMGNGTGDQYGVYNSLTVFTPANSTHTGTHNYLGGSSGGAHYGTYNWLSGDGTGTQYGTYNYLNNTGAGLKYGSYNRIQANIGTDVQYGVYSDVSKLNSFSGYFLGRFSIGTNATNNYILPASRGTANQIMQTDAAGNVNWVSPNGLGGWALTGNSGTSPTVNFIGTTDNQPLHFRVFNVTAGRVENAGSNTALGYNSLGQMAAATTSNTAFGNSALRGSTTLANNTGTSNNALGYQSLFNVASGSSNSAFGIATLYGNATGSSNIAIGNYALFRTTAGSGGVAIGNLSMYWYSGPAGVFSNTNTALGTYAMLGEHFGSGIGPNNNGLRNTATGYEALQAISSGNDNTVLGFRGMYSNGSGSFNSAFGSEALYDNTIGADNVALGKNALRSNVAGSKTVALGRSAMEYANSATAAFDTFNTAVGFEALRGSTTAAANTGYGVTAVGSMSMRVNSAGNRNSGFGCRSLSSNTNGVRNTAVGFGAAESISSGYFNTALGAFAYSTGNFDNSVAIGDASAVTASNQIRLGDAGVMSIGGSVGWTTVSDARFKTDVKADVVGLDFIQKLRPVTYRLNPDAIATHLKTPENLRKPESEALKAEQLQTGFIAQEVEAAAKASGFEFSGIDRPKNANDFYGLRYAEFVVPLVKAIQEQQQIIETEKAKNAVLEQKVSDMEVRLQAIEAKIKG